MTTQLAHAQDDGPTSSSEQVEIRSGRDLRDRPGPEARDAVVACWLADLADRHPGRHFVLIPERERLPVGQDARAG